MTNIKNIHELTYSFLDILSRLLRFTLFSTYSLRILTGFVVVQENIKSEVLKVQTELGRSVQ